MNLEEYVVVMVVFLLVVPASIISTARHNVYERVSCNRRQIETLPLPPLLLLVSSHSKHKTIGLLPNTFIGFY